MSFFDSALDNIAKGLDGTNQGIPIPFERLRQYIPNIQQKTFYLVGAGTKVYGSVSYNFYLYLLL